jgi:uncharacterized protein (DUF433 family)
MASREDLLKRISIDPNVCFGKPCIRGTRLSVSLIVDNLAEGVSKAELLEAYPQLQPDDIHATLVFAAEIVRGESSPCCRNRSSREGPMMKRLCKDALGWGTILWLIGYVLGMLLFAVVPPALIGWIILPIGTAITLWVLLRKVKGTSFPYYLFLAAAWTLIAAILDYLLIVKALKPADGYYKLDVYLYYILTFVLPIVVGWYKVGAKKSNGSP